MKYLLPIIIILLSTPLFGASLLGESIPPEMDKSVSTLDKDLNKAFQKFMKSVDKEISKSEKSGSVGLASQLKASKQKILDKRHFSELGEAAEKADAIAVKISSKWLKKEFHATKVSVDKRGIVTLYYEFNSPKEIYDFELNADDVKITKGMMSLGALVNATHKAKWDGDMDIKMEVSHANRKGSYLTVGANRIYGHTYNSWFIRIGASQVKFASDYFNSGSLKTFKELEYKLTKSRSILNYGTFEGDPVTLGVLGGQLRKGRIIVHGADGGANIKSLLIKGVLNMDAYLEE